MENSPKQLGDFEILCELGRGGMGVVYEAKQKSLNRRVALKVLSTGLGLTTKAIMRFKREAEAAAKLHHTNIVPIYSTGEENHTPYYAMELIDGPSLDQVIRHFRQDSSEPPPGGLDSTHDFHGDQSSSHVPDWVAATIGLGKPGSDGAASSASSRVSSSSSLSGGQYYDNVARMMAEVADALAHAHDQGVIHRDIKPSNLLLSADGRLSVNDFGLARLLEQPGMTISGELMGSPMYMSPEQIAAGRLPLDHRTDIYSLGATLYEMLALRPPFDGRQRDQVLSQIVHKEPVRPRSVNKRIPKDLETICLKAMEKDPDRRYQTADALADDLRRFVDRHAISARRIGPIERGVRWAKKNKALATMGCVTVAVIVGSASFMYLSHRDQQRRHFQQQALTAAMSGKLSDATDLIDQARDYGASDSWWHLLHAQVALFNGQNKEAINSILHALDQGLNREDELTARAMLADAYLRDGDYNSYLAVMNQLEGVSADSTQPETRIFLGRALMWVNPSAAVTMLESAIEEDNYPIAYAILANAEAIHALDSKDAAIAKDALQKAAAGMEFLGNDNPIAHAAQLYARLAIGDLEPDHVSEHLAGAEDNVDYLLKNAPDYMRGLYLVGHYHLMLGDYHAAIAVMEKRLASKETLGYVIAPYCFAAIESEDSDLMNRTLLLLERVPKPHPTGMFFRVLMLLGMKAGDGQTGYRVGEAREIMKELMHERADELSPIEAATSWLLGEENETQLQMWAKKTLDKSEFTGFYQTVLEFQSGDLGPGEEAERKLLDAAGDSSRYLGEAHYYIGLRQLYQGRRVEAWESFASSVNEGMSLWAGSVESRGFWVLRKRDPSWPAWLPTEPIDAEAK